MTYLIATYGTLKKGLPWHHLLKKEKYLGTSKTKGTMQLSYGGIPYLFELIDTQHTENRHTIEIYKTSQETYEKIKHMEIHSGYYIKEINTKFGKARIFYTIQALYNPDKKIIKEYTPKVLKKFYNQLQNEHN